MKLGLDGEITEVEKVFEEHESEFWYLVREDFVKICNIKQFSPKLDLLVSNVRNLFLYIFIYFNNYVSSPLDSRPLLKKIE